MKCFDSSDEAKAVAKPEAEWLSQEEFAEKCGFARMYMSRIEAGGANPSLDAVQTLATALRTPLDELFKGL